MTPTPKDQSSNMPNFAPPGRQPANWKSPYAEQGGPQSPFEYIHHLQTKCKMYEMEMEEIVHNQVRAELAIGRWKLIGIGVVVGMVGTLGVMWIGGMV